MPRSDKSMLEGPSVLGGKFKTHGLRNGHIWHSFEAQKMQQLLSQQFLVHNLMIMPVHSSRHET